jgi:hypothetical protein
MRRTTLVIGIGALFSAGIMIWERLDSFWFHNGWSVSGWCAVPYPPLSVAEVVFILVLIGIGVVAIAHNLRSVGADRELSAGLGLRDQIHNNK